MTNTTTRRNQNSSCRCIFRAQASTTGTSTIPTRLTTTPYPISADADDDFTTETWLNNLKHIIDAKDSDNTEPLPLRNMISMIAGIISNLPYFRLERLNKLETNYTMQNADVEMNNRVRIK